MKLTKSRLKELIRQSIKEIDFEDEEAFKKYQSQHKMRPSTKVNIGGKDTTVGQASGGSSEAPSGYDPDIAPDDDTPSGGAIGDDGEAPMHWDEPEDTGPTSDPLPDRGGSKKLSPVQMAVKKMSPKDLSNIGPGNNHTEDGDYLGSEDYDPWDAYDSPDMEGIDKHTNPTILKQKYIDLQAHIQQAEGELEDAEDMGDEESTQEWQEKYKKAAKAQNAIMSVLQPKKRSGGGMASALGHRDAGARARGGGMYDSYNPKGKSIKESRKKPFKTTVKEVKKWMKTLEENRYKKTYASDARRVSWLVNNKLSEDYEAMPISMKKKWPKAAYKRERQLAKEFVKHLNGETKLRESIRRIIKGLIND